MKTVNNIFKHTFFCLALGTTVCSCDLDVEPTSSIATETFWTSEKDAWYNLNAVYSASIPGAAVHSDSYTNDAYCQYSWESNGVSAVQEYWQTKHFLAGNRECSDG